MKNGAIIYSTDPDWKETCLVCDEPLETCSCKKKEQTGPAASSVKIGLEKKGRAGKTVTTVSGIKPDPRQMQKTLQQLCGAGGTFKNGIIEIQGDHREKIRVYLEQKGIRVKGKG